MPTDEIAHLLGFTDVDALGREGRVLARRIEPGQALEPSDWRRALLAAEIVFASDLLGAGSIGRSRLASRMRSQFGSCAAFSGSSLASLACLDGPAA